MIICSCNVLSDHEVRIAADGKPLRTVGALFRFLGCTAQCGRCAQSIKRIMDEHHCHHGVRLAAAVGGLTLRTVYRIKDDPAGSEAALAAWERR